MKPVNRKRWLVKNSDPMLVSRLAQETGHPSIFATLLVNRRVEDSTTAQRFISATLAGMRDPFLLLGMDRAVDRITAAMKKRERICVYGDYDVDGISAVALLISFFRTVGADCFYHIPKRLEDGYGLSCDGLESIASQGAKMVITVDCGITAGDESRYCASLGMDLIITDHHTPGPILPDACAVINPHQAGCPFPFKSLAGVGVAFYLLIALRSRLRKEGYFDRMSEPNLRQYLDLVALGTIADIVPLVEENRIFVKYGLTELTNSDRVGVQALKRVAGVAAEVTCGAVGFRLAPRLNAAGRLEDAALGVELLLSVDPEKAAVMASELDAGNAERQSLEQQILADALAMVKGCGGRSSIVLASEDWHPGVIGIVASRIVDLFHRPTILIALKDGNGRGSGRSIPSFHLHDALHACSDHLLKFGGHKYAAGLSIEEGLFETFVERFDEIAQGLLSESDLIPELTIDAELSPEEITLGLAELVEKLSPFGMGNAEPIFLLQNVLVAEQKVINQRHLKLRLSAGRSVFEAIGFNMAGDERVPQMLDVAFSLEINNWNGRRRLQLRLRDYRDAMAH